VTKKKQKKIFNYFFVSEMGYSLQGQEADILKRDTQEEIRFAISRLSVVSGRAA
jgi:hypothetical protein